jgi:arginyl-tRNA synthetase
MSIKKLLNIRIKAAMIEAGVAEVFSPIISESSRPEFGDFQANGVMAAAKEMGSNPRQLALNILDKINLEGIANKIEIAGPGFINIFLSNEFLNKTIQKLVSEKSLGVLKPKPQKIVIDYSSPNLAKEMHVGHLRSTIIGDAVSRTLEFLGHNIVRQNHMGDWGTQFGMLIAELEDQQNTKDQNKFLLSDLEKFYQQSKEHFDTDINFANKAREYVVKLQSGDENCLKLWKKFIDISIAHSESIYLNLNVTLKPSDIRPESFYNDDLKGILVDLENQNLAKEDQGAKVVFLDELADKNGTPSPVIIEKSGGGFLYATTDLAALRYRNNILKPDRILYFIDVRQSLHMKQIFILAKKAGFVDKKVSLEHHAFGTMMDKSGKPFKTRSGGTVKLNNLLKEATEKAFKLVTDKNPNLSKKEVSVISKKLGIGAVKYADLSKNRSNDYIFDWDSMLSFEGNTSPYLQYAYTRIYSIFEKISFSSEDIKGDLKISTNEERKLALVLLYFGETLEQVAAQGYPHILCNYLYNLASSYMVFYEHCPILKKDIPPTIKMSRLILSKTTSQILKKGLNLLGIEVMEKM